MTAAADHAATALPRIVTLTRRADFLRAARAHRAARAGFVLQMRRRSEQEGDARDIRVGFTCSKKVGNAVARNRAKRRLRAVAREALPALGRAGHDYVLIGRKDVTATLPFATLKSDLTSALAQLHRKR